MVTFIPVSGATNVTSGSSNFQIFADFSQILDPDRVNTRSFLLRLSGSAVNLSGPVFRDSTIKTRAVFTPSSGIFATLSPATSASFIPIVIGSGSAVGLRSIEGFFVASVSASFVTSTQVLSGETAPLVSGTTPVSGTTAFALSGQQIIKFSEAMASSTISTTSIKIRNSGGSVDHPATVVLGADLVTATLTPTVFMSGGGIWYNGFVHPTVTDIAGLTMVASYTWAFATVNPTAPSVIGLNPNSGDTNVSVTVNPRITFDRQVASSTVSTTSIKWFISGSATQVSGVVTLSSNLTTVVFTPNANWSYCTLYNAYINNTIREVP